MGIKQEKDATCPSGALAHRWLRCPWWEKACSLAAHGTRRTRTSPQGFLQTSPMPLSPMICMWPFKMPSYGALGMMRCGVFVTRQQFRGDPRARGQGWWRREAGPIRGDGGRADWVLSTEQWTDGVLQNRTLGTPIILLTNVTPTNLTIK